MAACGKRHDGAPGGPPSVKGGIPGGVRGQADRSYPAGPCRLWRYDEEGAMTNIRTPNHLVLPRMLLALPAARPGKYLHRPQLATQELTPDTRDRISRVRQRFPPEAAEDAQGGPATQPAS